MCPRWPTTFHTGIKQKQKKEDVHAVALPTASGISNGQIWAECCLI